MHLQSSKITSNTSATLNDWNLWNVYEQIRTQPWGHIVKSMVWKRRKKKSKKWQKVDVYFLKWTFFSNILVKLKPYKMDWDIYR